MKETLDKLLKLNNVTLYKVSKETGIPYTTLSDMYKGNTAPRPDKLSKIADYFGVSVDYLMGRENDTPVLEIESAGTLAKLSRETRLLTYASKLMHLSDEQKELIYKMIDNMK